MTSPYLKESVSFNKYQPVVICDLDGVIAANPPEAFKGTINDPNYWHSHWDKWDEAKPNHEIVHLLRLLAQGGTKIVILTSRPDTYRDQTTKFLKKLGLRCDLIMRSTGGAILPSDEWKHDVIEYMLGLGYDIKLLIEDYKPNVEAARSLVPCLLYERKK